MVFSKILKILSLDNILATLREEIPKVSGDPNAIMQRAIKTLSLTTDGATARDVPAHEIDRCCSKASSKGQPTSPLNKFQHPRFQWAENLYCQRRLARPFVILMYFPRSALCIGINSFRVTPSHHGREQKARLFKTHELFESTKEEHFLL